MKWAKLVKEIVFTCLYYQEIKSFLKNKPGWVTTKADVPFTTGFYFDFSSSGSVAGDHLF